MLHNSYKEGYKVQKWKSHYYRCSLTYFHVYMERLRPRCPFIFSSVYVRILSDVTFLRLFKLRKQLAKLKTVQHKTMQLVLLKDTYDVLLFQITYLGFLTMYSYMMIVSFNPKFSAEEILLIVWVAAITVEELRQVLLLEQISGLRNS